MVKSSTTSRRRIQGRAGRHDGSREPALFKRLTVKENLELGISRNDDGVESDLERIYEMSLGGSG